jgi:hypothetical protein
VKDPRAVRRRILGYALGLPGAWEDHPWEEDVVKAGKKVFVFLGLGTDPVRLGMTVKLRDSHEQALTVPGAEPTGYGLGRSGGWTFPSVLRPLPWTCSPTGWRRAIGWSLRSAWWPSSTRSEAP